MSFPLRIKSNFSLISEERVALFEGESMIRLIERLDVQPVLRLLPWSTRYSIATFLLLSLLIGSFFKMILYRYVLVSSKKNNGSYFNMTPINVMIFTSAIIHHITHLYAGIYYALSIGTNVVFSQLIGMKFCNATLFIGKRIYSNIKLVSLIVLY